MAFGTDGVDLERKGLIAIELIDPVSLESVSDGLSVDLIDAAGERIDRRPVLSASRRFVWLVDASWPSQIRIDPGKQPYVAAIVDAPSQALGPLVRVILRPSQAYPFEGGVTAIRATLVDGAGPARRAVEGAEARLAFGNGGRWIDTPANAAAVTDAAGQFAVFARAPVAADVAAGRARVRLSVRRGAETRWTPDDFDFSRPREDVAVSGDGRVVEGRLTDCAAKIDWKDLAHL